MNAFEQVQQIIRNRRSTKPALLNGQSIPQEQVQQLLELADWAPTHAHTQSPGALQYMQVTPRNNFVQTMRIYTKAIHLQINLLLLHMKSNYTMAIRPVIL